MCAKISHAVNNVLRPKWPSIFDAVQGFKNCVGAIDCTHVHLKLPGKNNASDYTDKNRQRSTMMQAIVDSNMRFLNVAVGFPASIHD